MVSKSIVFWRSLDEADEGQSNPLEPKVAANWASVMSKKYPHIKYWVAEAKIDS
jgi:hypothetical protein